ncbi:MAG: hypothetical protein NTV79_11585 [Candidatus Aureabacteria bacterium]|nr:hypothetical protein [Candidatus Auribacterota bacterium]
MISPGSAFWLKHPDCEKRHIFFVVFVKGDHALLVNATTYRHSRQDTSCIIELSEYPHLPGKSIINYADAIEPLISDLEKAQSSLDQAQFHPLKPASPELLAKMQAGAKKSPALRKKFKAYFEDPL